MSPTKGTPNEKIPVTDYLRATDSVSRPLAIFLILVILSVFTSILFGLFLGGRWVYDELKGDDKTATTSQTENAAGSSQEQANKSESAAGAAPTPTTSPSPSPTPLSVTPSTTPTTTSQTGSSNIPNTGPEPE